MQSRSRGLRRIGIAVAIVTVTLIVTVASLPFVAGGANNRLEQRCSELVTWTFDRSHPVPLFWTCTGQTYQGEVVTLNIW